MGGHEMAPHTPQRSEAPRRSRAAPRFGGGVPGAAKWPPHPPTLGSAPAEPGRSSIWRWRPRGREMAPIPPNARKRPGGAGPLLDLALASPGPRNGPHTPQRSEAPRRNRAAPRFGVGVPGAAKWPPYPPTLGSAPAESGRSSIWRWRPRGREMAPIPPNARKRPGGIGPLLDLALASPGPRNGPHTPQRSEAPRRNRAAPRFGVGVPGAAKW